MTMEEIIPKEVPPSENAAPLYQSAFALLKSEAIGDTPLERFVADTAQEYATQPDLNATRVAFETHRARAQRQPAVVAQDQALFDPAANMSVHWQERETMASRAPPPRDQRRSGDSMAGPYTPASAGLRMRPGSSSDPRRPIASALPLDNEHVHKIDQSHQRCAAFGLSRIERLDYSPLGRSDLSVVRERNQRLYAHAAPVMEMLYEQIVNSESMVLLCDATGTILHSIGDQDFLNRASKVALQPGVNWSEQAKGTNAVGTALIEESPRSCMPTSTTCMPTTS